MGINPNYYYLASRKRWECSSKRNTSIAEIQRRARLAAMEAGCENIPTDLLRLARFLGVTEIRELPLAMRGRLISERLGCLAIEVNNCLTPYEKRQTIAHELGHLLVEGQSIFSVSQRYQRLVTERRMSYVEIENFCDVAAGEILIPQLWLEDQLWEKRPSVEVVRDISEQSATSVEAVAARIVGEALWRCRFISWKVSEQELRALKSWPEADEASLLWTEPVDRADSLVTRCWRERCLLKGTEEFRISGETGRYTIQCMLTDQATVFSVLVYN